jgi:purine nucleosidase
MHKVVWDMDPGIDDALALVLALKSPEVQILGITTVAGNAPVEMTGVNARRVLEFLNADDIPVAKGAESPLNHPLEDALNYHGTDGLGNCSLPSPLTSPYPAKAWNLLASLISDTPGELTLVATGPLTNIAYAFELHPELPGLLRRLVLMGGAYGITPYGIGNRTPYAEFNIWQDPEAAHIVFNSGADIFTVGLDVTMDPATCLTGRHLEQIKTGSTPAAHMAAQLVEYEVKYHECCRMHDPLALATLLDDSLLDFAAARVEIVAGDEWDRGLTRVLPSSGSRSIQVARGVDGPRFIKLFLSRILGD